MSGRLVSAADNRDAASTYLRGAADRFGFTPAELALALFDPLFAALERGELLAERLCEFEDNARVETE